MHEIIKNVILSGRYELSDMLAKIDTIWLQGGITEDERTELTVLAQEKADPENSYAPLQRQITTLFENYTELAGELKALSDRVTTLEGGSVEPEEPEEYPAWYRWDGIGLSPWNNGSKCNHNGKKWVSHVDNNIWEPGAEGVHETIWEEIEE